MADSEDLEYVKSGATDLVGCVLDGADLRGLDLRGRDFGRAHLKNADFSGSDLSGSNFSGAEYGKASFRSSNLTGTQFDGVMYSVDFSLSSLKSARVRGLAALSSFEGANLEFADFRGSTIKENCKFTGSIVNEETNFEGVKVLRPYSKEAAFKYYNLQRGTLVRKLEPLEAEKNIGKFGLGAIRAIEEAQRVLNNTIIINQKNTSEFSIGHNQPPPEFSLTENEIREARVALQDARDTIETGKRDAAKIQTAIKHAQRLAHVSLEWIAKQADNFATEFFKEAGKAIGSKTALLVTAAHFSGAMTQVFDLLSAFLR